MTNNFIFLSTDWGLGINVTITGVAIVFGMLLLLVFVLSVFGLIFSKANGTKKEKAPKEAKPAPKKEVAAQKPTVAVPVNNNNDEIVAVIAAAVAAMYDGSDVKPVIRKIKKSSKHARPAWTSAGIFENTRSF